MKVKNEANENPGKGKRGGVRGSAEERGSNKVNRTEGKKKTRLGTLNRAPCKETKEPKEGGREKKVKKEIKEQK